MDKRAVTADTYLDDLDVTVSGGVERKIVALRGGVFIGTVGLRINPRGASAIRQLFVHEGCRRQGVGSLLLAECINQAQQAESESLSLSLSLCDRDLALPFYRAHGFKIVASYDDGELALAKILESEVAK